MSTTGLPQEPGMLGAPPPPSTTAFGQPPAQPFAKQPPMSGMQRPPPPPMPGMPRQPSPITEMFQRQQESSPTIVYPIPLPGQQDISTTGPQGATTAATDPSLSPVRRELVKENEPIGCCSIFLGAMAVMLIIFTFPFSLCFCMKIVKQYERAVIFRFGKVKDGFARGPGLHFIIPCIDQFKRVDMRIVSCDVPKQEFISKDSVSVTVDAVVYFRVSDAIVAYVNVKNAAGSTSLMAQSTLRNVLGTKTLSEMLANRERISRQMAEELVEATEEWGIKVERIEIKDIRLPQQMQRAMAAEAEATRESKAKLIAAEGERNASMALRDAANTMAESPTALQLRYLQTLNTISAERSSTIIFPFPLDMVAGMLGYSSHCDCGKRHPPAKPNQPGPMKDSVRIGR